MPSLRKLWKKRYHFAYRVTVCNNRNESCALNNMEKRSRTYSQSSHRGFPWCRAGATRVGLPRYLLHACASVENCLITAGVPTSFSIGSNAVRSRCLSIALLPDNIYVLKRIVRYCVGGWHIESTVLKGCFNHLAIDNFQCCFILIVRE